MEEKLVISEVVEFEIKQIKINELKKDFVDEVSYLKLL